MIKKAFTAALLTCCLVACAQPPAAPPAPVAAAPPPEAPPAPPPRVTSEAQVAPGRWDVERVRCSDLLGADDDDRAAAAMFYFGYLAAKAGIHVVDVSQIDGNIRKVMDRCATAPNITVPQAFRQALARRQ
jgi:hypothetical protein